MPAGDFEPWSGAKLQEKTIRSWYESEYRHYPVMRRKERVEARIKRWLEMELNETRDPNVRKDRKKKAAQKLKAYWKTWPAYSPFTFYVDFIAADAEWNASASKTAIEEAAKAYKRKTVLPEDLAPLLHIYDRMFGISADRSFDHVVVDEAQDFSPFQIALLNRHVKNGSFTILGDLSQGIHAYKGIRSWNEFLDLFESESRAYFTLERSYRSTMEIIRFANAILARGIPGSLQAVPVFRSGEKVKVLHHSPDTRMEIIVRTVRKLTAGNHSTVAVIGRTEVECRALHSLLLHEDISATLIDSGKMKYEGGLSVVPVYLAKGLEFDAVLLIDADSAHYGDNEHDARLMYVGCTRALHDLWVMAAGEPSPLIADAEDEFAKHIRT